jgi:hypothetical protein
MTRSVENGQVRLQLAVLIQAITLSRFAQSRFFRQALLFDESRGRRTAAVQDNW